MRIRLKKITLPAAAIAKKEIRHHLKGILFDYDEETRTLTLVGTDAVMMIITRTQVEEADADFCKRHNKEIFIIPEALTKEKTQYIELSEAGDDLRAGDHILKKIDAVYPNYMAVIPTKNLVLLGKYVSFPEAQVKAVNKALGIKAPHTITDTRPVVNEGAEGLTPVLWKTLECDVILMPRRLDG